MRFDGILGHDDLTALQSFALDLARVLKVHVGGERHTVTGDVTKFSIITVFVQICCNNFAMQFYWACI